MNMRSTRSTVTFCHPFTLKGRSEILPAGAYEVLVEEEELQGVSFLAYRKDGNLSDRHETGQDRDA